MSPASKPPEPPEGLVEDVPPGVDEDESAWHEEVLETEIKEENPELYRAVRALQKKKRPPPRQGGTRE